MPNLNVKGESPRPSSGPVSGGGGGGSKVLITVVIAIVVLAGAAFILNTTGIVKLWGKKKAQPVVMSLPMESVQEPMEAMPDTATPLPVEENAALEENLTKLKVNAKAGAQSKKMIVTGTGMYTIQISSWTSVEMANRHAEMFTNGGMEAFVEKRGSYYRVCIGRYETKKSAREKAAKMEHMLESMPVVSTVAK